MTIQTGSRLGPYEIKERIGVGGMGEVWRASDSRLDREVAIKIISDDIVVDFPSGKHKRQVSEAGMGLAIWSADGTKLYLTGRDGISVVTVTGGESPTLSQPRIVIERSNPMMKGFGVIPLAFDGRRFLALKYSSKAVPEPLRLIWNWQTAIAR